MQTFFVLFVLRKFYYNNIARKMELKIVRRVDKFHMKCSIIRRFYGMNVKWYMLSARPNPTNNKKVVNSFTLPFNVARFK